MDCKNNNNKKIKYIPYNSDQEFEEHEYFVPKFWIQELKTRKNIRETEKYSKLPTQQNTDVHIYFEDGKPKLIVEFNYGVLRKLQYIGFNTFQDCLNYYTEEYNINKKKEFSVELKGVYKLDFKTSNYKSIDQNNQNLILKNQNLSELKYKEVVEINEESAKINKERWDEQRKILSDLKKQSKLLYNQNKITKEELKSNSLAKKVYRVKQPKKSKSITKERKIYKVVLKQPKVVIPKQPKIVIPKPPKVKIELPIKYCLNQNCKLKLVQRVDEKLYLFIKRIYCNSNCYIKQMVQTKKELIEEHRLKAKQKKIDKVNKLEPKICLNCKTPMVYNPNYKISYFLRKVFCAVDCMYNFRVGKTREEVKILIDQHKNKT